MSRANLETSVLCSGQIPALPAANPHRCSIWQGCPRWPATTSQGAARNWDVPARLCCPMPGSECPKGLHFSFPVAVHPSLVLSWWPLELEQGACETVLAQTMGRVGNKQMPCEMQWGGRG